MNDFLTSLLLAAAITLAAFAVASSARAQQADEDPAPAAPHRQPPQAQPQSPKHDSQLPSGEIPSAKDKEQQTEDTLAFTGRVVEEKGVFVLNDSVTKINYHLDDQLKAKVYAGKQVKILGKLEMKSNTIHIDSIEPMS